MYSVIVSIIDKASLALASDIVRDGEIAESDIRFDKGRKAINLTIWKHEYQEQSSIGQSETQPINWYDLPLRRYEIEFKNVNARQTIKTDGGKGKHPIGGLRFHERGIICLDTYDGVTFEFTVDELDGTLWRTGRNKTGQ